MRAEKTLQQHGFGTVSAIFLLVILAGLTAAIANLSAAQRVGVAQDVQGVRAYQAARAGIEWGLYQSLISSPIMGCPLTKSFVPPASTLNGFTVTVDCVDSADNPIVMRRLTAVACNEPDTSNKCPAPPANRTSNYIERRLQATIRRP